MVKAKGGKKQVHIVLSRDAVKELQKLKSDLGVSTVSDVIRSSIALTKFISMEKASGNEIIIRNKKTNKEKIFATLR